MASSLAKLVMMMSQSFMSCSGESAMAILSGPSSFRSDSDLAFVLLYTNNEGGLLGAIGLLLARLRAIG